MENLSARGREDALRRIGTACAFRAQGLPEEEVAAKAGLESIEHMRWQFEQWCLPEWFVHDSTPAVPQRTSSTRQDPDKKRRAGSVVGKAQELPPAKGAASLFREALNKFLDNVTFLQREYENESSRRFSKEYLQDRRFLKYTREEVAWAVPSIGRTRFTAAGRSPGNGLTQLIAVYLLAFGDPEPLIEKLHYDPDSLDREQLRKHIEGHGSPKGRKPGLLGSAEDVAILIRGGKLQRGVGPGELDVAEQIAGQWIRQGWQKGVSDQEIIEMLSEEGISISKAEIGRLGRLNLPNPSS